MLPHVCGSASTHAPYNECWRYMAAVNSWEKTSNNITRNVNGAAKAYHEDWGIIMAGGRDEDGSCCSNYVTFTTTGEDFEDLALLQESSYYHCVAGINSSHMFMTGLGLSDKNTYMYSTWSMQWVSLPAMPTGRRYAGCGLVRHSNGSISVVVAGGLNANGDRVNTSEIYSVEEESWKTGIMPSSKSVLGNALRQMVIDMNLINLISF